MEGKYERTFAAYFFADHQVEYIVSLKYCFFLRMNILWFANVPQNLHSSKINCVYGISKLCMGP